MIVKQYPLITFSTEPGSDVVLMEIPVPLEVDLEKAQSIVACRLQFTENRQHYLVADTTNVQHVTAEAKEFLQQPSTGLKNIIGAAFVGNNPVAALIANIFIKTPKDFESRFFPSREAALAWIEDQKMTMKINKNT